MRIISSSNPWFRRIKILLKIKISKETICLLSILFLAVFLRLWRMEKWPITHDEAYLANFVFDIIKGKRTIYDVANPFQGQMILYILLPSIYFFGNNVFFLRLPIVLITIFSIYLLYLFTKKYYDKKIALLASFILGITPNDILNSSVTIENLLTPFFIILSLYLFYKFTERRKGKYLHLFAFIWGLAVMTRLNFIFFIVSFLITLKVNPFISFKELAGRLRIKDIFLFLLFFVLGLFPFFYWNLTSNFETIQYILNNFPSTGSGANLLDIKTNLLNGYIKFANFLDINDRWGVEYGEIGRNYFFIIFLISGIMFVFIPFIKYYETKKSLDLKKNLYLFINFLLILIMICTLTITRFRRIDFATLFPFYSIMIAWIIVYISNYKKIKSPFLIFIFLFFSFNILIFFNNLNTTLNKQAEHPCRNIKPVLNYLEKSDYSKIFINLEDYREIFQFYLPNKTFLTTTCKEQCVSPFNDTLKSSLSDQNVLYVFMNNYCRFFSWQREMNTSKDFVYFMKYNKTIILEKVIESDGKHIFEFYRII